MTLSLVNEVSKLSSCLSMEARKATTAGRMIASQRCRRSRSILSISRLISRLSLALFALEVMMAPIPVPSTVKPPTSTATNHQGAVAVVNSVLVGAMTRVIVTVEYDAS